MTSTRNPDIPSNLVVPSTRTVSMFKEILGFPARGAANPRSRVSPLKYEKANVEPPPTCWSAIGMAVRHFGCERLGFGHD